MLVHPCRHVRKPIGLLSMLDLLDLLGMLATIFVPLGIIAIGNITVKP